MKRSVTSFDGIGIQSVYRRDIEVQRGLWRRKEVALAQMGDERISWVLPYKLWPQARKRDREEGLLVSAWDAT